MAPQMRKGAMVWKVKDKDEPKPAAEPEEKPDARPPKGKSKFPRDDQVEESNKGGGKGKGKSKKAAPEPEPEVPRRVERPKEGRRKGSDESDYNKGSSKPAGKGSTEAKESSGKKSAKGKGKDKGKDSVGGKGSKGKGRGSGSARGSALEDDDVVKRPMRRDPNDSHKQHIEAIGEKCSVKKHSSMGIAVVSMHSAADRDAVLAYAERMRKNMERERPNGKEWGPEVDIGGLKVELKRHTDKTTGEEMPTDIFAAWGHQGEKESPLEGEAIAEAFDELLQRAMEAKSAAAAPAAAPAVPSPPFTSTTYVQQQYARSPPPPPGHYPNVGQVLAQSAAYGQQNPSPAPQQHQQQQPQQQQSAPQPAFPDSYSFFLAQQQFAAQQQQQQMIAYQHYQQQMAAQQQQQLMVAAAAQQDVFKPLPKPLKIVDPKQGKEIETLGLHFKPREEKRPLKIINPQSGESIPGTE